MNYFWCKKFFQIFISFFIGIFFFRNILVTCKLHNTRCALRHFGLQSKLLVFILQDLSACYSHRLLSLVPDKPAPPGSESRCFLSPRDSRLNLILSVLHGGTAETLGSRLTWSLESSFQSTFHKVKNLKSYEGFPDQWGGRLNMSRGNVSHVREKDCD